MKNQMIKNKKTFQKVRSDDELKKKSDDARRNQAGTIAAIGVLICLIGLGIDQKNVTHSKEQGMNQGEVAVASAQSLLKLKDPVKGYSLLSGRFFEDTSEWGSLVKTGPSGDEKAVEVEVAFSNKEQCKSLVEISENYFDFIFIDQKIHGSKKNPEGNAQCSSMGQNTIRLVKEDPRDRGLSLSAGERDWRGGVIPSQAISPK